ncbi:TetR family transcriptional regulator [Nocardia sp. alder85J]|uniref:TetR/AcrR family transcriptional regulator n=1 Tax=Nocardia sp. alder85J TaxID=2862949 RepID=UPI001CD3AB3E|nr:TetR/AcrR family transcriptional regulator [Nocardia sp. alder85J]MCX4094406.1 TetR family transcriptional regulator [Nocardia sp. alder85J]
MTPGGATESADGEADDGSAGGRTGRRPGQSGTREAILAAARSRFAEVGFDKASIRSIATAAGVDPALVHHYFGTKQELLAAAMHIPIDPELILAQLRSVPLDTLGETIVRAVVSLWDSPVGVQAVVAIRSILGGGEVSLARAFLFEVVLKEVRARVDSPPGSGTVRAGLAVAQMIGVLVARKVIGIEPLVSLSVDELTRLVGPTLQRYLTGDLDLTGESG